MLASHGIVNSIKDFYWDVRPKPEYGTIELRVLDTPLHPSYAAALASYARELCLEVHARPDVWPAETSAHLVESLQCGQGWRGRHLDRS